MQPTFTDDEIQAFTETLDVWRTSLSEREQHMLDLALVPDADSSDDEVSGHMNPAMYTAAREAADRARRIAAQIQKAQRGVGGISGDPYGLGDLTDDLT